MPSQPAWFHRLDAILTELCAIPAGHLDRHAVEKLFGVAERRARQLMAGLPCLRVGNAVAVERLAMIAMLESTAAGDHFEREVGRRARVADSIETMRKHAAARRVELPSAAGTRERILRDLSPGIELQAGELRIRFERPEDLAAKLFELSQAMANDWDAFTEACAQDG